MDFYNAPPKKNGRRKKAHVKVLPTLGQPGEDLLAAPGRKPLVRFEAAPASGFEKRFFHVRSIT